MTDHAALPMSNNVAERTARDPIYLDFNATTPILPEAVDAMLPYLREHFGNPSSGHVYGSRARKAVARAREQVAAFLGCDADEVVFTSGGAEANNLAIRGVAEATARRHVVTSIIEHPTTSGACDWLAAQGGRVLRVGVDTDGRVRLNEARAAISNDVALVTVMHSNNETGVLQPVAELVEVAHAAGALIHTDAAQSLGKVPVDVRALGVDLLTLVGHKLYGPKGIGALYVKRGTLLAPVATGTGHEFGLRAGTENVPSIVALGVACEGVSRDFETAAARMLALRDTLWDRLAAAVPGLALNGHRDLRLPNTLNVRFPKVSGNAVLAGAPAVAASAGSACHAGNETASAVIMAMGIAEDEALGSVRLTVGRSTSMEDIKQASEALIRSWQRLASA